MNGNRVREQRKRRHARVRARIQGSAARPRFSVFRSNRHLLVQLIDDRAGRTLVVASDADVGSRKDGKNGTEGKKQIASALGELVARKAQEVRITEVVFDRGGYQYHGLIQAVAEGARKGGLRF